MFKKITGVFGLLIAVAIPVTAWASPRTAICMVSSLVGNEISSNGSVRASKSFDRAESIQLNDYVVKGRDRIDSMLWEYKSAPDVLFLDGKKVFGMFDYNQYGSAVALPHKTCLMIGPKGTNIDVVSHELVHADIADMLGYWRVFSLPAWINEGVAMQVDMRERYGIDVLDGIDVGYVRSKSGKEFYADDVDQVVKNYAAARYLFSQWIEVNGVDQLQIRLKSDNPGSHQFLL